MEGSHSAKHSNAVSNLIEPGSCTFKYNMVWKHILDLKYKTFLLR